MCWLTGWHASTLGGRGKPEKVRNLIPRLPAPNDCKWRQTIRSHRVQKSWDPIRCLRVLLAATNLKPLTCQRLLWKTPPHPKSHVRPPSKTGSDFERFRTSENRTHSFNPKKIWTDFEPISNKLSIQFRTNLENFELISNWFRTDFEPRSPTKIRSDFEPPCTKTTWGLGNMGVFVWGFWSVLKLLVGTESKFSTQTNFTTAISKHNREVSEVIGFIGKSL